MYDLTNFTRYFVYLCRLLGELKKSVRNRAKPEKSIMEAWVAFESLTFCAIYLQDFETTFNRQQHNNDGGVRSEHGGSTTLWRTN